MNLHWDTLLRGATFMLGLSRSVFRAATASNCRQKKSRVGFWCLGGWGRRSIAPGGATKSGSGSTFGPGLYLFLCLGGISPSVCFS